MPDTNETELTEEEAAKKQAISTLEGDGPDDIQFPIALEY